MNSYNPYDLIPVKINEHLTFGRPVAFDSDVCDTIKMVNSKGLIVKPTELVTTCPDCGSGLVLQIDLPDPPFGDIEHQCICKRETVIYPFMNPLQDNRIRLDFLDPKLALPSDADQLMKASNEVEQRTKSIDSYIEDKQPKLKPIRKHGSIGSSGIQKEVKGIVPKFQPKSGKTAKPNKKAEESQKQPSVKPQEHISECNQEKIIDPVQYSEGTAKNEHQASATDEDLIKTLSEIDDKTETYLDKLLDELE
jgi:hypothetical protein